MPDDLLSVEPWPPFSEIRSMAHAKVVIATSSNSVRANDIIRKRHNAVCLPRAVTQSGREHASSIEICPGTNAGTPERLELGAFLGRDLGSPTNIRAEFQTAPTPDIAFSFLHECQSCRHDHHSPALGSRDRRSRHQIRVQDGKDSRLRVALSRSTQRDTLR